MKTVSAEFSRFRALASWCRGKFNSAAWWIRGHGVAVLSSFFFATGMACILVSRLPLSEWWVSVLTNLGTGLVSSVALTLGYEAVNSRDSNVIGINYFSLTGRVMKARHQVAILSTYSYLFTARENIPARLDREQIAKCRLALDALASNPDIKIRVLLLDPNGPGAAQRAQERTDENVTERIRENLAETAKWVRSFQRFALEVRVYRSLPRLSLIRIDDFMSISFFERNKSISESQRNELTVDRPVARFVESSFESLWKDPTTINVLHHPAITGEEVEA